MIPSRRLRLPLLTQSCCFAGFQTRPSSCSGGLEAWLEGESGASRSASTDLDSSCHRWCELPLILKRAVRTVPSRTAFCSGPLPSSVTGRPTGCQQADLLYSCLSIFLEWKELLLISFYQGLLVQKLELHPSSSAAQLNSILQVWLYVFTGLCSQVRTRSLLSLTWPSLPVYSW